MKKVVTYHVLSDKALGVYLVGIEEYPGVLQLKLTNEWALGDRDAVVSIELNKSKATTLRDFLSEWIKETQDGKRTDNEM